MTTYIRTLTEVATGSYVDSGVQLLGDITAGVDSVNGMTGTVVLTQIDSASYALTAISSSYADNSVSASYAPAPSGLQGVTQYANDYSGPVIGNTPAQIQTQGLLTLGAGNFDIRGLVQIHLVGATTTGLELQLTLTDGTQTLPYVIVSVPPLTAQDWYALIPIVSYVPKTGGSAWYLYGSYLGIVDNGGPSCTLIILQANQRF